jgi:hypothetical protein
MKKLPFIIIFLLVALAHGYDITNRDDFFLKNWTLYFQYIPPIDEPWQKCGKFQFVPEGTIINKDNNEVTGEWYQVRGIIHFWIYDCGKIKGWFKFIPGSIIFEGLIVQANPGEGHELAKIILINQE